MLPYSVSHVEGSGFKFKSRFNKFTNVPELMTSFREVADVQTPDMTESIPSSSNVIRSSFLLSSVSDFNCSSSFFFCASICLTVHELYVMQLYLQKKTLERMGIYHFDSWAANFGEVTTALELTVEGSGFKFKSRFNKFTNVPELNRPLFPILQLNLFNRK